MTEIDVFIVANAPSSILFLLIQCNVAFYFYLFRLNKFK